MIPLAFVVMLFVLIAYYLARAPVVGSSSQNGVVTEKSAAE